MNIRIFYDDIQTRIRNWKKIERLIERIIKKENKTAGKINYIITTDKKLQDINIEFMKHHYYTDVVTFNYNEGDVINGEVYISIDTVKRNSINYKVSLNNELLRVMFHGILHLCGYDDKTEEKMKIMRRMEEEWIKKYHEEN